MTLITANVRVSPSTFQTLICVFRDLALAIGYKYFYRMGVFLVTLCKKVWVTQGLEIFPKAHRKQVEEPGFKPRQFASANPCLVSYLHTHQIGEHKQTYHLLSFDAYRIMKRRKCDSESRHFLSFQKYTMWLQQTWHWYWSVGNQSWGRDILPPCLILVICQEHGY